MQLIPFSDLAEDSGFSGLLPSIERTNGIIDRLKGNSSKPSGGMTKAVESTAAIALGAALTGAARASGWNPQAIAVIGGAVGLYAIHSGQPLLLSLAQGVLAPAVAQWAEETMVRPASAPVYADNVRPLQQQQYAQTPRP